MHLAYHVAVLGRVRDMPSFDSLTAKALATPPPPPPKSLDEMRSRIAAWLGHPGLQPSDIQPKET